MQPLFAFYKGLLMMVSKACAKFRELISWMCYNAGRLRLYLTTVKVLGDLFKSDRESRIFDIRYG